MHKARYWEKSKGKIHCTLCPQSCYIEEGKKGLCMARKNVSGTLYSMVYGKPVAVNIDPVEKKPLYHFLPGSSSLSVGTAGCNLGCLHCQNYDISRADPEDTPHHELPPEAVVKMAAEKHCESISYTYNEPTVFHEYAIDCAKLARKNGIKNILVTNGFINRTPAEEFIKHMDAANVDLKAYDDDFYKKICKGRLEPVLSTLKLYYKRLWLEITYLIIEGKNDDMEKIRQMCIWISENLGRDVPLHFSRAFPMYKMQDIGPTPEGTLLEARKIALEYLDYVYIGNIELDASSTRCPKCGALAISRKYYNVINDLKGGRCHCGHRISGVFSESIEN